MRRIALGVSVLAATAGLWGCADASLVRASRDISLTAPWQEYARIIVQTHNGHVEVACVSGSAARISAKLSVGALTLAEAQKRLDEMEICAAADPDDPGALLVRLDYPATLQPASPGASLDIQIPAACAAEICTDNGRICVYDLGPVKLATDNGRIQAERIAGTVDARTSNGRIVIRGVEGSCRAETSNGSVDISSARGGLVEAHTSSGSIQVQADPPPDAAVTLSTSNGAIHAVLPASMTADLAAHTSLGDVDVDFGPATVKNLSHKRDRLHAALNGGGGQINASTSLGSITIKFTD